MKPVVLLVMQLGGFCVGAASAFGMFLAFEFRSENPVPIIISTCAAAGIAGAVVGRLLTKNAWSDDDPKPPPLIR